MSDIVSTASSTQRLQNESFYLFKLIVCVSCVKRRRQFSVAICHESNKQVCHEKHHEEDEHDNGIFDVDIVA